MILYIERVIQVFLLVLFANLMLSVTWPKNTRDDVKPWFKIGATVILATIYFVLGAYGLPAILAIVASWTAVSITAFIVYGRFPGRSLLSISILHLVWAIYLLALNAIPTYSPITPTSSLVMKVVIQDIEMVTIILLVQAAIPWIRKHDRVRDVPRVSIDTFSIALSFSAFILAVGIFTFQNVAQSFILSLLPNGSSAGDTLLLRSTIVAGVAVVASFAAGGLIIFDLLHMKNLKHNEKEKERVLIDLSVREMKGRLDEEKELRFQLLQLSHDLALRLMPIAVMLREGNSGDSLRMLEEMIGTSTLPTINSYALDPLLETVLSRASRLAENEGATIIQCIDLPRHSSVPSEDLCIILGNALDNAVNACHAIPPEKKPEIRCFIGSVRRMLVLRVENPYLGVDIPEPGVGLQSIQRTIDRLGGQLELRADGRNFELLSFLPIRESCSRADEPHFD